MHTSSSSWVSCPGTRNMFRQAMHIFPYMRNKSSRQLVQIERQAHLQNILVAVPLRKREKNFYNNHSAEQKHLEGQRVSLQFPSKTPNIPASEVDSGLEYWKSLREDKDFSILRKITSSVIYFTQPYQNMRLHWVFIWKTASTCFRKLIKSKIPYFPSIAFLTSG